MDSKRSYVYINNKFIKNKNLVNFKNILKNKYNIIDDKLIRNILLICTQTCYIIPFNIIQNNAHRAMGDVQALEKLYEHLCEECSKKYNEEEGNYMLENPEKIIEKLFV